MGYTKGEWIVTQHNPLSNWVVDVKGDDVVTRVTICQCYNNKDDAHLIASAPELYKALKLLVGSLETKAHPVYFSMANRALSKAEM